MFVCYQKKEKIEHWTSPATQQPVSLDKKELVWTLSSQVLSADLNLLFLHICAQLSLVLLE